MQREKDMPVYYMLASWLLHLVGGKLGRCVRRNCEYAKEIINTLHNVKKEISAVLISEVREISKR
jgi:hypothetical protein